jgi:hypothetical protein
MGRSISRQISVARSGGPTLPAQKATGDASGGVETFFVIYQQGQKVDSFATRGAGGGHQNRSFPDCTNTAPPAWGANRPVVSRISRPSKEID